MATVHDVAAYILARKGTMTAMKLQKLVYYSQAWSLVWDSKPLFDSRIEAWVNGPVVRDLYDLHRREFEVSQWPHGSATSLTQEQRETIDGVLSFYGDRSSQWLSDLTHMERPWCDARKGMLPGERGSVEITPAAMAEYYGGLQPSPEPAC
jgi:uncharacterized phage-associated protein